MRVNLDAEFFSDTRLYRLAHVTGMNLFEIRGRLTTLYHVALEKTLTSLTIDQIRDAMWMTDNSFVESLVSCNLLKKQEDGSYYIRGITDRIECLKKFSQKQRERAEKRWTKQKQDSKKMPAASKTMPENAGGIKNDAGSCGKMPDDATDLICTDLICTDLNCTNLVFKETNYNNPKTVFKEKKVELNTGYTESIDETEILTSQASVAPKKETETAFKKLCKDTFETYAQAYSFRYGTPPLRNAKLNSQIKQFCQRVGADSPFVVKKYLSNNSAWYIKRAHEFGTALSDAEKLWMEYKTNITVTDSKARTSDLCEYNAQSFKNFLNKGEKNG